MFGYTYERWCTSSMRLMRLHSVTPPRERFPLFTTLSMSFATTPRRDNCVCGVSAYAGGNIICDARCARISHRLHSSAFLLRLVRRATVAVRRSVDGKRTFTPKLARET